MWRIATTTMPISDVVMLTMDHLIWKYLLCDIEGDIGGLVDQDLHFNRLTAGSSEERQHHQHQQNIHPPRHLQVG